MFGFGSPGKLGFRRVGVGVGQVVIGFEDALVTVFVAEDDQNFFGAFLTFLGACDYAPFDHLDPQRTFGPIAHVEEDPVAFVASGRLRLDACPGALGLAAPTRIRRRFGLQIADLRI